MSRRKTVSMLLPAESRRLLKKAKDIYDDLGFLCGRLNDLHDQFTFINSGHARCDHVIEFVKALSFAYEGIMEIADSRWPEKMKEMNALAKQIGEELQQAEQNEKFRRAFGPEHY